MDRAYYFYLRGDSGMGTRIGDYLVLAGVLTEAQVQEVLEAQRETQRPFGWLCEELFSIAPEKIERAWAQQYAGLTEKIDPSKEDVDSDVLHMVTRRQAWQFRIMPIRFDGEELMVATTLGHIHRALRFATNVMGSPVYVVLTTPEALARSLSKYYPLPGMGQVVIDRGLDAVLGGGNWIEPAA